MDSHSIYEQVLNSVELFNHNCVNLILCQMPRLWRCIMVRESGEHMDLPKGFSQDGNGRDPRKRRLRKLSFALLAGLAALVLCATWYWLASPYSIEMSEKNPINAAPNSGATRESMTLPDRTVLARAPEEARKSDKPDDEAQRRKQDEARTLQFQAPTSASDGHDGSGSPAPLSDGTYAGPRSEGYRPPSPPLPAPVSATAAKPDFDTPDVVVGGLQGGQSSTAGNIRPRAANESPDAESFQ